MSVLKLEGITMKFGGVVAINDLSMHVEESEIVALIGPNGAGKTTVFNVITGVYKPTMGSVWADEKNITPLRTDHITKRGLARTFQNIRLFKGLTVLENIQIAQHMHCKSGVLGSMLHLPKANKENKLLYAEAMKLLRLVGLEKVSDEEASSLPYGDQRKLEIARAIATKPKLLLLDEPAAGMNPQETDELTQFIRKLRDVYGLTILMIEHHMDLVMEISDRIYVLDFGELIAEGNPEAIQQNERVIGAYLGVNEDVTNPIIES